MNVGRPMKRERLTKGHFNLYIPDLILHLQGQALQ
jgi:hypothetical protein